MIIENVEKEFARTIDTQLNPKRVQNKPHAYTRFEKKKILELQPGPTCANSCRGCTDIRKRLCDYDTYFLSDNPSIIDRIFDILEIPAADLISNDTSQKWRIQISGSVTDPTTMGIYSWERILKRSKGHDIILHTASLDDWVLSDFLGNYYLNSEHFESGGKFVFVRSHNAPVFNEEHYTSFLRTKGSVKDFLRHLNRKQDLMVDYSSMRVAHLLFNSKLKTLGIGAEKFTTILKQLIYLEDADNSFSIKQKDSIDIQRESIKSWEGIAEGYMIAPAFFKDIQNRKVLQGQFKSWMHELISSFKEDFPNMDLMCRTYGAKPQKTDKSGVSEYQYTINRAGFFTPCDYSEMPLPGLPRIDNFSLTKKIIDEEYSKISYKKEPCCSCQHKNCTHDFYE